MASTLAPKLSPALLSEALKREPLMGMVAAAKLMGIKPPNFRRDAAGHLTEVPVEGSANVYFRSEVERLARERAAARSARENGGT